MPSTAEEGQTAGLSAFERRARALLDLTLPHRQFQTAINRFAEFRGLRAECPTEIDTDERGEVFRFDQEEVDYGDAHVQALMVVGASGTGKSALLNWISARPGMKSKFDGPDGDVRPIIRLDVPDVPTPKEVVREICAKLNSPMPAKFTRGQISRHLRGLFRDVGLRFLQMDEAHVFVEYLTERQVSINARFLKFMLVDCQVPIILAGEPPLEALLRYDALARRMAPPIRLSAYSWGQFDDLQEWLSLASSLAGRLGFPEWRIVDDFDLAMRLYLDTGGVVGLLAKRLIEAGRVAVTEGEKELGIGHFSKAWSSWQKDAQGVASNPFAIGRDAPLTRREDPYFASPDDLRKLWQDRFGGPTDSDGSRATRRRAAGPKVDRRGFLQ